MNVFSSHLIEWFVLILILGASLYTMFKIKDEKISFKDDSYEVRFGRLSLKIPNWWTITEQSNLEIIFKRTDTRYDWWAKYQYIPNDQNKSLPELLQIKLDHEEIEFDMDVLYETDSRVLFRNPDIQEYFQEVIRVEGKASEKVIHRIYYDIYLTRGLNEEGYFIFESWSSVLNGLVEGPFFEESLSELSFTKEYDSHHDMENTP